ncbi:FtsX-like permease family protein [Actinoplanes subtropicus]|uniref:FtsX-like permease family protein n=1 Tax=Actinoplanes subtropicus TaxID=543632 RepID=UPI00054D3844|nr:FtsX-like permease family protein [Actinoplanes subtropicus]
MAARRAVVRWAWRMFRREWRQQALVLALLTLAVTATVFGLGVAANAPASPAAIFGNADYRVGLPGSTPNLDALRASYPTAEIIEHRKVTVRGLATALDVRGQAPDGPLGKPKLRLTDGRYPSSPGEVALTPRVARLLGLRIGSVWQPAGHSWTVVGLVENPLDLLDTFALVQPGSPGSADRVEILVKATRAQFEAVHRPDGSAVDFRDAGDASAGAQAVLILATVGLLFVGLLAAAGFTVLAQHRQRALGMLGAVGARQRHLRLVTQANGALVGMVAATVGGVLGLLVWFAGATRLERLVEHRIDRFDVPWPEVAIALLLAFLTAVLAAWWPARGVARVPIVTALSDRPPRPRPAHRFALAGVVLTAAGLALLVASKHTRPLLIITGILATAVGMLLLAPLGVAALAAAARICPVGPRLALRDLARYRARSGAALAAISLGTGIAAAVVIGAGAAQAAGEAPPIGGNLPPDQLIVWLSPERISGPVPTLSAEDLRNTQAGVQSVADGLPASWTLPLVGALDPKAQPMGGASGVNGRPVAVLGIPEPSAGHTSYRGDTMIPLLVATPALLQRYGIDPASVDPSADVLTARTDLSRYDLLTGAERPHKWQPVIQRVTLPVYTSEPIVLLTDRGMRSLGLTRTAVGWLVQAPAALTPDQVDKATTTAIAAGLSVETRPVLADMARVRAIATGIGVAVALGVLAMTVGLIRGEGAGDLRTLTANGAGGGTRRILAAATAAALGGLGALLGVAGAYAAQIAWHLHQLHWLGQVPLANLVGLVIGLPLVAALGGGLLGGRAPSAIARTPL